MHVLLQRAFCDFNNNVAFVERSKKSGEILFSLSFQEIVEQRTAFTKKFSDKWKSKCVGILITEYDTRYLFAFLNIFISKRIPFCFLSENNLITKTIIEELNIGTILVNQQFNARLESLKLNDFVQEVKRFNDSLSLWILQDLTCIKQQSEDILYIFCTTGTTGKPKYVKVFNNCIKSNIICLRKKFNITQTDTILLNTPFSFDPIMIEIFLGLTSGATLIRYISDDREFFLNSKHIASHVSFIQMCPSIFQQWNRIEIQEILNGSLRILVFGGERFPNLSLQGIRKSKNLMVFNIYGITEVSCWASIQEVTDFDDVHLGTALDDTFLEIRNEEGQIVDEGQGELFIGSAHRICLIDNEKLEDLKLPICRRTGDIVEVINKKIKFLGRKDRIIKRMGHRVNLNHLEDIIYNLIGLETRCVEVNDSKLVTFIEVNEESNVDKIIDKIRVRILKIVSSEYIPDSIHGIHKIPSNSNGKIDYSKLRTIAINYHKRKRRREIPDACDAFSYLWCKYFAITTDEAFSKANCSFYEMGGSSILSIQFIEELKEELPEINIDTNFRELLIGTSFKAIYEYLNRIMINQFGKQLQHEHFDDKFHLCWKYNMDACCDTKPVIIENE